MSNQKNYSLVYFRRYSDFCFRTEDGFKIRVSENEDGMTEVFVEYSGISRRTAVFQQCALKVFYEVSPTDWICGNSGYLIQLYQQKQCISCQNIENFSEQYQKVLDIVAKLSYNKNKVETLASGLLGFAVIFVVPALIFNFFH